MVGKRQMQCDYASSQASNLKRHISKSILSIQGEAESKFNGFNQKEQEGNFASLLIQSLGPKPLIISDKTLRQTEARKSIGHPGHEPVRVAVATFFLNMQFKCLDTGIQYSLAIFELFTNAGGFEGGCVVGVWEGTGNLTQAIRCPSTCTSKHEADLLE